MKTINFMYFAHNFDSTQLDAIMFTLGNTNHFKSKFDSAKGTNGTEKFLNWFMMLSKDNMLIVLGWIEANYKNL